MIVPITDDWRIRSDERCWTVEAKHVPTTGKRAGEAIWRAATYHPTLAAAVLDVYEARLRAIDADTLEAIGAAVRALQDDVARLSESLRLDAAA